MAVHKFNDDVLKARQAYVSMMERINGYFDVPGSNGAAFEALKSLVIDFGGGLPVCRKYGELDGKDGLFRSFLVDSDLLYLCYDLPKPKHKLDDDFRLVNHGMKLLSYRYHDSSVVGLVKELLMQDGNLGLVDESQAAFYFKMQEMKSNSLRYVFLDASDFVDDFVKPSFAVAQEKLRRIGAEGNVGLGRRWDEARHRDEFFLEVGGRRYLFEDYMPQYIVGNFSVGFSVMDHKMFERKYDRKSHRDCSSFCHSLDRGLDTRKNPKLHF